jgi:hypothetical protein
MDTNSSQLGFDSDSTIGYGYNSDPEYEIAVSSQLGFDSDSTIGYGYNSDPEYEIAAPTKCQPWWEGREGNTPDATKLQFVKTWIVEKKATNTSPSPSPSFQHDQQTQTGAFEEPISMDNLNAALESLNLTDEVNTDYEVAAINATASLNAAKVRHRRAEERAELKMAELKMALCTIHQRLSRQVPSTSTSTSTSSHQ